MSSDSDNEYFSDGISEAIINALTKIQGLKVIARTSAMRYKGSNKTIAEIGQELSVNHILEGSVRKLDNRIRITAQLINVEDEYHIWEGDFDKRPRDFFEIHPGILPQAGWRHFHPPRGS